MEDTVKTPATEESVWAAFREGERLRKEADERYERRSAEAERLRKESDERHERRSAEAEAKFDRELAKSRADHEQRMKEWDEKYEKSRADYDRRMKKLDERYGSFSNNIGEFAEEYFFNSFEDGKKNFFGEEFDDIERNVKGLKQIVKDEYDIVMLNGTSVAIVETKFKAHVNDLPDVIKKAETFRINHPQYANHRIFLGLASMSFYADLEKKCAKEGIAVIKQVGDNVVIIDEQLKVF